MSEKKLENIKELPIMPQVATKIIQMQEENLEISFKELEQIVLLDPALTAKILKVSNSALYARQREINNLQQAITLLGFKTIKSLVLLVCASNMYGKSDSKDGSTSKSSVMGMWRHLIVTAFVARYIATKLQSDESADDLFIAGLLHDIGRVVFILNDPGKYNQFMEKLKAGGELDVIALEEEIFGYNHQEAGKIVFQKWNFPEEFIDAISMHHSMHVDSPHKQTVEIVGLSNLYARILMEEPLSAHDTELKEAFKKSLSVPEDVEEYITNNFLKDIEEDDLYKMSTSLS